MKRASLVLALGVLASPLLCQEIVEPKSGAKFPAKVEDKSLLGAGLRTKTFLKVQVYALGLYVADGALAGPLAAYKGQPPGSPAFYKELVQGDFPKQVTMKFLRNLDAGQIQEAMREALVGADKARVEAFVSYFPAITSGQECVLRWAPGGTLETVVAGTTLTLADTLDFAFVAGNRFRHEQYWPARLSACAESGRRSAIRSPRRSGMDGERRSRTRTSSPRSRPWSTAGPPPS